MKGRLLRFFTMIVLSVMVGSSAVSANVTFSENDVKIGAWLGEQANEDAINSFQTLQNRKLDTIMAYLDWNTSFSSVEDTIIDPIYDNGSTAIITWEQWGLTNQDIIDGVKDSYIIEMADEMKSYGQEIWISLMHEANGNWYDWAIGDSDVNTNETYIAAYRHVVTLFRQQGADNVKWIWNVNCSCCGTGSTFLGHYPGDDYVDFIAIDGYNWGTTQSWGSTWQSFDEIFSDAYTTLCSIDKPILITEFASTEIGGDKAEWITDAFDTIRTKYPRIKLVSWFGENKETDWRINSSDTALAAYREAVNCSTEPISSAEPSESVEPADGAVQVEVTTQGTNYVSQDFCITASGEEAVDLSKLVIKYTFTKADTKDMNFWCDNAAAQLECSPWYVTLTPSVQGTVVKDGSSYTVKIAFTDAFSLAAGSGYINVQTRFANADWSGISGFQETGMQIYYDGQLIK